MNRSFVSILFGEQLQMTQKEEIKASQSGNAEEHS